MDPATETSACDLEFTPIAPDQECSGRPEQRTKVVLLGHISGIDPAFGPVNLDCLVIDTSRHGCRIGCNELDRLPNDVEIRAQGCSAAVRGRIVWRKGRFAGVRLMFGPR